MHAEFHHQDATVRVICGSSAQAVALSVERPGREGVMLYLPPTLARAIGSALVGAAADAKKR